MSEVTDRLRYAERRNQELLEKVEWAEERVERAEAQLAALRCRWEDETRTAFYWRANYRILFRVLSSLPNHQDPAYAWLDEIVHTRFSKLL